MQSSELVKKYYEPFIYVISMSVILLLCIPCYRMFPSALKISRLCVTDMPGPKPPGCCSIPTKTRPCKASKTLSVLGIPYIGKGPLIALVTVLY